jgi:UPF0755 protein
MSGTSESSIDDEESAPEEGSGAAGKGGRRRKKRRVRKRLPPTKSWSITTKIALALGALLAVALTAILIVYPHMGGPGTGKVVELEIAPGSTSALAEQLSRAGLVESPRLFRLYATLVRANAEAIGGSHLLTDDLSPSEVLARVERKGGVAHAHVTFPEGYTRFDMARRLLEKRVCSDAAFLKATNDHALLARLGIEAESAEGFLFPATYELSLDSDPQDVVSRLAGELDRRYHALVQSHQLGAADLESSLGWKRTEIVTLASMIEKEAAVDDERQIIASVFLNRLRDPSFKRKVLQSDPTSAYGCLVMRDQIKSCAGFNGKITHDLNVDPDNLYSTYVHEKLPPGPICNPGAKSLEAVLAPASTKYLYFVARGEGRHAFSETYEAHTNAVKTPRP